MPAETCPNCGSLRHVNAPKGLCPRCLLLEGLSSDSPEAPARHDLTVTLGPASSSVLAMIGESLGGVPGVLLRDTDPASGPGPMIKPTSAEMPEHDLRSARLQLFGEIARGGMGAVLKGRDSDLGRDLAVKVLLEKHRDNPDLIRRFVEEAQIGGQLQHPGVVPVYELGAFGDRRPYFAMKLVKGQTLAELLTARPAPAHDLPRFLSIFAAVAQTMAYAHTRGVIHRDLKPSNVMVGSFGEVQVMDWGLAKVLPRGGAVEDAMAGKEQPQETVIATARSRSNTDHSQAGSALGTPSYMAPEQARGETDRMNERVDVFALGSILCEILTGTPAFTGRSSSEIIRKAASGDTADAISRLGGCGAEPELIALAKDCLSAELEDRPRDANVVSDRITAYLAGVQVRVQAAERERAVAETKAIEERRRHKVQLALAASVVAFTTLGGLSTSYYLQQRATRAAALERVIDQVTTLHQQAIENPEEIHRWEIALAAIKQAGPTGDPSIQAQLVSLQKRAQQGLAAARRDKALLDRLVDIRSAAADDPDGSIADHDYAEAFNEAGIDIAGLPPIEAGAKLKARPAPLALAFAAALDDWAIVRQGLRGNARGASKLREIAKIADADPWRIKQRIAMDQPDIAARRTAFQALAKAADYNELGPTSLHLLGIVLDDFGENKQAESVLRKAQERYPRDVWINFKLGHVLKKLSRRDEAIRFFTAARAIRPETAHELAHALEERGDSDESIAVFRELTRLRPGNARHLGCLGEALQNTGRGREAIEVLEAAVAAGREAIRLTPMNAFARDGLARSLRQLGRVDEAIAEHREVIRLMPDLFSGHSNLGVALHQKGDFQSAEAAYRTALRLAPHDAALHYNLGLALERQGKVVLAIAEYREAIRLEPDDASAHDSLASALTDDGKIDEAVSEHHEAIRLKPNFASAHYGLGNALFRQNKTEEAIAAFREAIRLKPDHAEVHNNLGNALRVQHKPDQAATEFREAIRLNPGLFEAHFNLGAALLDRGKIDEAAFEFLESIRSKPDLAIAHERLGFCQQTQGKLDEALASFRRAAELAAPGSNLALAMSHKVPQVQAHVPPDTLDNIHRKAHELEPTKPGEAEPLFRQVLEGYQKTYGPDGPLTIDVTRDIAALLDQTGRATEAEPIFRDLLKRQRAQVPIDRLSLAGTLNSMGIGLLARHRWIEAESSFREALEIREKTAPDDWSTFGTRSRLGGSLLGQKKFIEAEPLIVKGYEGMKAREASIPSYRKPSLSEAADRVIKLYEDWAKPEKAAEWRARLAKPADAPECDSKCPSGARPHCSHCFRYLLVNDCFAPSNSFGVPSKMI